MGRQVAKRPERMTSSSESIDNWSNDRLIVREKLRERESLPEVKSNYIGCSSNGISNGPNILLNHDLLNQNGISKCL